MIRSVLFIGVRIVLLFIIFWFSQVNIVSGQDVHFSSPELTPLHINPSLTGDFNGKSRLLSLYQGQGSLSGRVISGSFDIKKSATKTNGFAFGLSGHWFELNNSHDYEFSLSTSYSYLISNSENASNVISIGARAGLMSKEWDVNNNLEIGSGVLWKYINKSGIKVKTGLAFFYVNKPMRSFDNGKRWNLHAELEIPLSHGVILVPDVVLTNMGYSTSNIFKVSTKVFLDSSDDQYWLKFGVYRESNNTANWIWADGGIDPAYGFSSIFKLDQMLLGFSIDRHFDLSINIFEMSFGYIFGREQTSVVTFD